MTRHFQIRHLSALRHEASGTNESAKPFCESNSAYGSIVPFSKMIAATIAIATSDNEQSGKEAAYGYVYLFKSGRYYKVGMTKDTYAVGLNTNNSLPERMDLRHSIQTDDPSGVESYWHRRLTQKRMNGELVRSRP